ncbi:MAG: bifunctional fucokinase/L-fucose-1-P-guanylyltransferase [Bacteroidales bacterium]|nr:bifunctional fucokinase/L-fucose-1-P-guanylyltransferase [Bacteroidales bacterium]
MKTLLSLPPNLVDSFHDITGLPRDRFLCTSDPIGHRIGSGGGTTWLLEQCRCEGKKIIIHAGGESRRLPSYSTSGKILTPIPVFRWKKGQSISQNLLSLQLPLYESIMEKAPHNVNTLIASGDVFIRTDEQLQDVPEADVICYGVWVDSSIARNHGVFASRRDNTNELDFMLQKPSLERISELSKTHVYMMDIGLWLLSDRAIEVLKRHSKDEDGNLRYYDLYSDFGRALGKNPEIIDEEINSLTVKIIQLEGGEFYHYGTSRELLSSTLSVQNIVNDQNKIFHYKVKPHPAIFTQNCLTEITFTSDNSDVWIENSHVNKRWTISSRNIITGVPRNDWALSLKPGDCIDIIPIGEDKYVARPYDFHDSFKYVKVKEGDPFKANVFPITDDISLLGEIVDDMLNGRVSAHDGIEYISAEDILGKANLRRLFAQRESYMRENLPMMERNHEKSVFYNLNLDDIAEKYTRFGIEEPGRLPDDEDIIKRIHNSSLRARIKQYRGVDFVADEAEAFRLLQEGLTSAALHDLQMPRCDVYSDQIVWSRSPVRIDLGGGWTDTPPYCLMEGGAVVNIAIELNGQQPIQVYIKPTKETHIVLRSIDLGAMEVLHTFDDIRDFKKVGSPFSIPKAALALSGFVPQFCRERYGSLEQQLRAFGGGMEITLLSAIPAGSGLGTSSVLSATVLAAISDFCHLGWDKTTICNKTLILEQLLTTGGGWQDQYGGICHGLKLLETKAGFDQTPLIRWLPDTIFTSDEHHKCHLLYYTGITRTAKNILSEIVRKMFLNATEHLALLDEMKAHAHTLFDTIQQNDFQAYGKMIQTTWNQNKRLDSGTNPDSVEEILRKIDDYCLGYKLPGAGGGGFIYMIAKDDTAAAQIKKILTQNPPNNKARFVEMSISKTGLQTTRS